MTFLLELKEFISVIYKRFEKIIVPVGKFIFCLIVLLRMNAFLSDFIKGNVMVNKGIITLGAALLGTFIPSSWFLLILMTIVSGFFIEVSIEAAIMITVGMIVVYLLFVRLFPKMAAFVILVPIFCALKIGYLIPIIAGLFFGPVAIVSVSAGVLVYEFSAYLPGLIDVKSESLYDIPKTIMGMYKYIMNALMNDSGMILTIAVFACVLTITYLISKLDYDYIWYIAIVTGGIVNILGFIIGTIVLKADISVVGILIGTIISVLICVLVQFMRFSLDYPRAEKVQFEDDDYYYFVKAIPKIRITKSQRAVQKIK